MNAVHPVTDGIDPGHLAIGSDRDQESREGSGAAKYWVPDFATRHARKRMKSRYGLAPTDAEWAAALLDIWEGWSTLHAVFTREEHHTVEIAGKVVPVVYSRDRAHIVTVLPWTALGQKSWTPPKRKWNAAKAPTAG